MKNYADSFTKMRHRPSAIPTSIADLTRRAEEGTKELITAKNLAQETIKAHPGGKATGIARDLVRAHKLLGSAKQGLAAATSAPSDEHGDALRYIRGAERAIHQARAASTRVTAWAKYQDTGNKILQTQTQALRESVANAEAAYPGDKRIAALTKKAEVAYKHAHAAADGNKDVGEALRSVFLVTDALTLTVGAKAKNMNLTAALEPSVKLRAGLLDDRLAIADGQVTMNRADAPESWYENLAQIGTLLAKAREVAPSDATAAIKALSAAEKTMTELESIISQ